MRPTRMPLGRWRDAGDLADRVGHLGELQAAVDDGVERVRVQAQAIEQRAGEARRRRPRAGPARWRPPARRRPRAGARRARAARRRAARAATRPCARRRRGRRRPGRPRGGDVESRSWADCPSAAKSSTQAEISCLGRVWDRRDGGRPSAAHALAKIRHPRRHVALVPGRDGAGEDSAPPSHQTSDRDPMKHIIALAALAVSALAPTLAHAGLDSRQPRAPAGRHRASPAAATSCRPSNSSNGGSQRHHRRRPRAALRRRRVPREGLAVRRPGHDRLPLRQHQRRERHAALRRAARSKRSGCSTRRRSSAWAPARATRRSPSSPATAPADVGNRATSTRRSSAASLMGEWLITPSMGVQLRYVARDVQATTASRSTAATAAWASTTTSDARRRARRGSSPAPGKIAAPPARRTVTLPAPASPADCRRAAGAPADLRRDLSGSSAPRAPGERARAADQPQESSR